MKSPYDTKRYNDTLQLIHSILGQVLKTNNRLMKFVVTGIIKINKAGLFSNLNKNRDTLNFRFYRRRS